MELEAGVVLANRYRITRPLGRGGMGEVFAAENIRTGRMVAIKLLRSESKSKSSAVARFRREARAAGSINSDFVTQVLDVEEDPDHGILLVFELLEGESLIDRLKRTGPIRFDELHLIIEQVWMGLADAHRAGIIHRDLKPSNVFLEKRPDGTIRVKILDFGVSKLPREMGGETLTEMGQSLGTFSFMPPEQISKAKTVDHRADIYACATLIYQALTGHLPYQARNILAMVELKTKTEPRKLVEVMGGPVDPRLEAFIAQGLARDPDQRFQSAFDALTAWRELRPGGPSSQPVSMGRAPSSSPQSGAQSASSPLHAHASQAAPLTSASSLHASLPSANVRGLPASASSSAPLRAAPAAQQAATELELQSTARMHGGQQAHPGQQYAAQPQHAAQPQYPSSQQQPQYPSSQQQPQYPSSQQQPQYPSSQQHAA
ncbi:MAG TPA: serine/threonine-protein kinase, partial [Candidatus Nanopelagicales bacterium]|nr:serine/threonine-protein kinase [Candidatus Nanopelagicales bacterium]